MGFVSVRKLLKYQRFLRNLSRPQNILGEFLCRPGAPKVARHSCRVLGLRFRVSVDAEIYMERGSLALTHPDAVLRPEGWTNWRPPQDRLRARICRCRRMEISTPCAGSRTSRCHPLPRDMWCAKLTTVRGPLQVLLTSTSSCCCTDEQAEVCERHFRPRDFAGL